MQDEDYVYIDADHRIGADYDEGSENPREWSSPVGFIKVTGNNKYIDVKSDYGDPTDSGLAYAHEHFDAAGYDTWDPMKGWRPRKRFYPSAEEITTRWARIFYGVEVDWDDTNGGYWFVDPGEFAENWTADADGRIFWPATDAARKGDRSEVTMADPANWITRAEAQRKLIEGDRETYRQWGEGEVYYVFSQERHIKHVVVRGRDGTVLQEYDEDEWDTEDSIGGIYLEEDEQRWGGGFQKMMTRVAREYFDPKYTATEAAQ
jgi:hypothetical protein